MSMKSYNLFPTLVGMFDLGRELTEQEASHILNLPKRANKGNSTSQDHFVLSQEELKGLNEFMQVAVDEYLMTCYAPKNGMGLKITQSWCNYTEPGQFHHKHSHPNSFLSGVFYVQTTDQDRIYFYKDGYQQIKVSTDQWNVWNSESWWLEATQGRLIIFPSCLQHMVDTVKGDATRISLSFNTFPVGNVGEDSELTGLQL